MSDSLPESSEAEKDSEIERLKRALYESEAESLQRRLKRARPDLLRGTTIRKQTPLGELFVNITEDDRGQPFEVLLSLGKAGGSAAAYNEAVGRLISLALRCGISLAQIHRQLRGIASDRAVGLGPNKVLSVPDAVALALEEWTRDRVQDMQSQLLGPAADGAEQNSSSPAALGPCPDCGSVLELANGAVRCPVCGLFEPA